MRLLLPSLYIADSIPITPCAPIDVCCFAFLLLIALLLMRLTFTPSAESVVLTLLRSVTKLIISDELAPDPSLVISDPVPRLTVAFIVAPWWPDDVLLPNHKSTNSPSRE